VALVQFDVKWFDFRNFVIKLNQCPALLSTRRGNYASTNKAPHPSPLPRGAREKEASLVLSGRVFSAPCTKQPVKAKGNFAVFPLNFSKNTKTALSYPLFFKNHENNYHLFGFLFQPKIKNVNNRKGVIFCDSLMDEKCFSHRVLVNFARLLQANGYFAFLFDYYGNGDSEGDFENTRLDTYLSDVKAAAAFFREETKVEEVCLLGLRFGSVFASLFAAEEERVERLILWSPVIDAGKYMYDSLRSNLNAQFAAHKKIRFNRDQLVEQIKNNILVMVDGYGISRDFYLSLSQVNLEEIKMRSEIKTLLVDISKNMGALQREPELIFRGSGQYKGTVVVQDDPFWIARRTNHRYVSESKVLFEKTLCWLEDGNGY
jgi:dienelactone hydrolase